MTQLEAQKIRSAFNNGFEYPFGQGGFLEKCDMDEVERHAELLDMALERQIPEKPIQEIKPNGHYYLGCPRCKQTIGRCRMYVQYCSCCGQALKWEEWAGQNKEKAQGEAIRQAVHPCMEKRGRKKE